MATPDQEIAHLAENAADELLAAIPTFRDAPSFRKSIAITHFLNAKASAFGKLQIAINSDESLGDLRGGWIRQENFQMVIQDHVLPFCLVKMVIEGKSVESFLEKARAFAATRTSGSTTTTALVGISLVEAISLGKGVDLIPWADVPDSPQKKNLDADRSVEDAMSVPMSLFPIKPASAIRIHKVERQVLYASHKEAESLIDVSESQRAAANSNELLLDVVRCVTALSACPVAMIGSWSLFDREIANNFCGLGYSWAGAFFDHALSQASFNPIPVDGKSLADLFQQFEKFDPSNKEVLRIALDRLSQAIRERNVVDKAIDIGIALEVMLLHGIGENDRGELRFRSSIRGATFLGDDRAGKLRIFKLLKVVYDLRSKAVHAGKFNATNISSQPHLILNEATNIAARIARKLIQIGSFPNWDEDYVLQDNNGNRI